MLGSEDDELPFQEGLSLQEEYNQEPRHPYRDIFMAIIVEIEELVNDPMGKVDLVDYNSSDYDEYLSDAEARPAPLEAVNYEIPPPPQGFSVTTHLEDDQSEQKKIHN